MIPRTFIIAMTAMASMLSMPGPADAQESSKTVLGPRNIDLADGAAALIAGDAIEGVRLTERGLVAAQGNREKKIAHSNLCAGYLLLNLPRKALEHCDEVIALDPDYWRAYNNRALVFLALDRYEESEADIRRGQALRPESTTLKEVRGLYLDETQPVTERVEVDDRRSAAGDADAETDD